MGLSMNAACRPTSTIRRSLFWRCEIEDSTQWYKVQCEYLESCCPDPCGSVESRLGKSRTRCTPPADWPACRFPVWTFGSLRHRGHGHAGDRESGSGSEPRTVGLWRSSMSITRRELLVGSAALAAGSVVTTPFFLPKFHSDHRLKRSRVAVLNAHQYSQDLDQILATALRLFPINVRGKTVVLKPNLVDFIPGNAINTHPLLVLAAAESFRSMGAQVCCCSRGTRTSTRHPIGAFTDWL